MAVMGPWMHRLGQYVQGGKPHSIGDTATGWRDGGSTLTTTGQNVQQGAPKVEDGFSSTSFSGLAARRAMERSATTTSTKGNVLSEAGYALGSMQTAMTTMVTAHETLKQSLPGSYMPMPDPTSHKYAQKGIGIGPITAKANAKQLATDQAAYNAQEAALAHAEKVAQQHVAAYDDAVAEAEPKIRALYEDPNDTKGSGGGSSTDPGPMPAGTSTSVPGSRDDVVAARARMAQYSPGTLERGGMGQDLIAAERAHIATAAQTNTPSWDASQGMWVQHDGSPAPSSAWAAVQTGDGGFSPVSGATLGVGLGAAGLGAGALALAKNGVFGSRIAAALGGTGGATEAEASAAKLSSAKVNAAKLSSAEEAKLRGPGSRGGAPRTAGADERSGTTGQRTGSGVGRGPGGRAGAAGGRGQRKGKKGESSGIDYKADYTDDWIDPEDDGK